MVVSAVLLSSAPRLQAVEVRPCVFVRACLSRRNVPGTNVLGVKVQEVGSVVSSSVVSSRAVVASPTKESRKPLGTGEVFRRIFL